MNPHLPDKRKAPCQCSHAPRRSQGGRGGGWGGGRLAQFTSFSFGCCFASGVFVVVVAGFVFTVVTVSYVVVLLCGLLWSLQKCFC